jgi:hypothetical protein
VDAIKGVESMTIIEVNEDCEIYYVDGSMKACPYRPPMKFQDCKIGYGDHGGCPKWDYYHKEELHQQVGD